MEYAMFDIIERKGDYYIVKYNVPMGKPFEVGKFTNRPPYFAHTQKHKVQVPLKSYRTEGMARRYFNKLAN